MTTLECSPRGEHHPDEALGRHHRIELGDQVVAADVEEQGPAVGRLGLMHHLGGDVGTGDPAAEGEELAETLVLRHERGNALGEVGGGVALDGDRFQAGPAGAPLFGAGLEPDQGSEDRLRRASETPWPHCSGEKRATTDRATHARKMTVSRRV